MRALVIDPSLHLDPRRPVPERGSGDTLVRVSQAGVCSTDLELTRGYMGFAGVPGHEFVGAVEESPQPELVGKRVVGEINVVCGRCDLCLSGLGSHCRNRSVLGILKHDGAFADYLRLPAANLHVVPDAVDDDHAVFTEPLAAALQVTKQVPMGPQTWVTVLGGGRLGLLVAQVLRNAGCPVRVVGRNPRTLELCEKWQVRSRLLGDIRPRHDQDVVVDCTGSAAGFELALAMVRPRGTIVLKSTVAEGKPLNLAPVVVDEISVVGSRCGPFAEALAVLAAGAGGAFGSGGSAGAGGSGGAGGAGGTVDVISLISRRFGLDQGPAAFEAAAERGTLKVLVDCS